MGTFHSHDDTKATSTPAAIRFALLILIPTAVAAAIGMALLWPGDLPTADTASATGEATGTIAGIAKRDCPKSEDDVPAIEPAPAYCGMVTVELTSGPQTGDLIVIPLPSGPGSPTVDNGDHVVLMHLNNVDGGQYSYHIIDHDRGSSLWILAIAFALAVIAFGRWRGVLALVGLAVTFAVLLLFIVPAILSGSSPLLVAIVGATVIMLAVLYLTHGFSAATTIAAIGTLASLVLTGLGSAAAVAMTHLTGVADEDTTFLSSYHGVDMQGLLLAGILIGSLGALDDVTVTQASAVTELARANPGYKPIQLYKSAARIGRAHIASVVNTIILAYAGASLPLLILIAAANRPLGQVITTQLIAQELVRSVVGTLGLIAAVPLTTLLASITVRRLASGDSKSDSTEEPLPAVPAPRPKADENPWLEIHDDSRD